MMKYFAIFLLLFSFFTTQAQKKITWPRHKKAVIVLTYDDGLDSQLKNAVPALEAAKLPATFFLIGDINNNNILQWRSLSKKGFELGNHTLYHPCMAPDNPVNSISYTPTTIVAEIGIMDNFLFAVDGNTSRTYAYPCTETTVGGKDYVDTLRKSGFVKYARVGGDADAIVTDFKHLDPLQVPAYGLDDNTQGDKLIAFVKLAEKTGGLGIIMFHGIGGDYITTSVKAHQQLITYLKKHRNEIWVATFQQAMDYATEVSKNLNSAK
ncbi:polysaccharide deacetylase family protein [Mucilaginibacter sp.]